jgi:hypothetical protein
MEKTPTTFIPTMDFSATMHTEMIDAAIFKDSSTYTGYSGRKPHIFDLARKTAVSSLHDTYTIETNVQRCLRYISSYVQNDLTLSSNGKERRAYPQPAKSTNIM